MPETEPSTTPPAPQSESAVDIAEPSLSEMVAEATIATPPPEQPTAEAMGGAPLSDGVPTDDGQQELMSAIDELRGGMGLSPRKYNNFLEALKGGMEAERLVGVRDEDAKLGRMFRADPNSALTALGYQPQQPQAPQPAAQPEPPLTYDQFQLLLRTQLRQNSETGELEPAPGVSTSVVDKVKSLKEQQLRAVYDLATNPDRVIGPYIDAAVRQAQDQWNQQFQGSLQQMNAHQADQAQVDHWTTQNAQWLFENGQPQSGLSARGHAIERVVQSNGLDAMAISGKITRAQALDIATKILRGEMAINSPAPPSPQAQRTPSVAATGTPKTNDKAMRDDESFAGWASRLGFVPA